MTSPHNVSEEQSVFAGLDVCEIAGLPMESASHRVPYDSDIWNLNGLAGKHRMVRPSDLIWDFTRITNAVWRPVIKDIALCFLAPQHEQVISLPLAFRTARSPRTVNQYFREWVLWLNWLTERGVDTLSRVTQPLCDDYVEQRAWRTRTDSEDSRRLSTSFLANVIKPVQVLTFYGDLFLADRYNPSFIPWEGRTADAVAGNKRSGENATPPLPEHILQPLMANCLYLVDVIGPHVPDLLVALREDRLHLQAVKRSHNPARSLNDTQLRTVSKAINAYREAGNPLPKLDDQYIRQRHKAGWAHNDPLIDVHVNRILLQCGIRAELDGAVSQLRQALETAVSEVGTAGIWGRDAIRVPHAQSKDSVAWTHPLTSSELHQLVSHVLGACMVLTAAITGMRRSEMMEIEVGCQRVTEGPGGRRYRLAAKLIKGQPFGGVPDEWVVIEEVHRAVALAERLTDAGPGEPLFGTASVGSFVDQFRRWAAGPFMQRLGLQTIPDGPVNSRILRRTLALELARRPGGLLAAKIHLKHVSVVTTEGYAARPGGSQSAFFSEVEAHEHAHHLDLTVAAYKDYRCGRMPSGPGARHLISTFEHIDHQLDDNTGEPNVIMNERRLENLLRRQADTLHVGPANYCWFKDPSKALCLRLSGVTDATRPLVGMCDSARCPQATHHGHHRSIWDSSAKTTQTLLGNPRIPKGEKLRLEAELDRTLRVVNAIDDANTPKEPDAHH